jgi:hypothetical protein
MDRLAAAALVVAIAACQPTNPPNPEPEPDDPGTPAPTTPPRRMDGAAAPAIPTTPATLDGSASREDTNPPDRAPTDTGPGPDAGQPGDTRLPDASPPPADSRPRADVVPVLWLELGGKAITGTEVTAQLSVIEDHDGSHVGLATAPVALKAPVGIALRGNFTGSLPKKPYSLELRDDAGMDRELPVLGMPPGSDWALYACYTDKTCLRYMLVQDLAQGLGRWSSRGRFVEVFLDGKYHGLYNLFERVRRDRYRVNIPKPAPDAMAGDLTGGYIFRHEGSGKGAGRDFKTPDGIVWSFHYPRAADLTPAQKTYLTDYVNRFDAAMRAPTWADPTTGYRKWTDVQSFVDYVIVQEVTNNWDGYARSVYFHKLPDAAGGKLFASPLWDHDLAFGNISMGTNYRTDTWSYDNARTGNDAVLFFFKNMVKEPAFQKEVRCRWEALRKGVLAKATLDARIDAWVPYIRESVKRDQMRWPTLGVKIFPNYFVGKTYEEEVAWLRDWIAKRLTWLDANLPGTCGV